MFRASHAPFFYYLRPFAPSVENRREVIVVGTSPPALMAACSHADAGAAVTVLDAEPQPGGSWHAVQFGGRTVDAGCYFLEPYAPGLQRLQDLGVALEQLDEPALMKLKPGGRFWRLNFAFARGALTTKSWVVGGHRHTYRSNRFVGRIFHGCVKPLTSFIGGSMRTLSPRTGRALQSPGGAQAMTKTLQAAAHARGVQFRHCCNVQSAVVDSDKASVETNRGRMTADQLVLTEGCSLNGLTVNGSPVELSSARRTFHHVHVLLDAAPLVQTSYCHFFDHPVLHRFSSLGENPSGHHVIAVNPVARFMHGDAWSTDSVVAALKDEGLIGPTSRALESQWTQRTVPAPFSAHQLAVLNKHRRLQILESRSVTLAHRRNRLREVSNLDFGS